VIPKEMLACDERCAPGGRCYDLTVESPDGPRLAMVVHWRIVPFMVRADTGAMTAVPDDGTISLPVASDDWANFPLLADVRP